MSCWRRYSDSNASLSFHINHIHIKWPTHDLERANSAHNKVRNVRSSGDSSFLIKSLRSLTLMKGFPIQCHPTIHLTILIISGTHLPPPINRLYLIWSCNSTPDLQVAILNFCLFDSNPLLDLCKFFIYWLQHVQWWYPIACIQENLSIKRWIKK